MEYATTALGHAKEIAVLIAFGSAMGVFVYFERRAKHSAPKPRGATKI